MKISFGLVVYNEEALIGRCLDSIKDVADEILIVHDGVCTDKTLEIAQKYTNQVFVRDRLGGSEPHRIYLLEHARNNWVFMIDADEFLSDELKNYLSKLNEEGLNVYGAVAFKWPSWNGSKYVTHENYRPCLFNKNECWAVALHNFSIQTAGKLLKADYVLEHKPREGKGGFSYFFGDKINKRLERDANQFLVGFEKLDKYNINLIPESFKKWYVYYIRHPLFYSFWNFFKYLFGSYKNLYRDGLRGLFLSFNLAYYQSRLAFKIWQKK
jgi:glycosyltransferase involved in cell wall biosynthesis